MRFLAGGFVRSIGADSSRKLRSSPTLGIRRHLAPDVTFPADVRTKHHTSLTGLRFPCACGAEDDPRRRFTSSSRSDRVPIAFGLVHRAPPFDRDGGSVCAGKGGRIEFLAGRAFQRVARKMCWIERLPIHPFRDARSAVREPCPRLVLASRVFTEHGVYGSRALRYAKPREWVRNA